MNVHEDGPHAVADICLVKLRAYKGMILLWVSGQGMVTIAPATKSWRRESPPPDEHLVGVYTTRATCKGIREDIGARLAEIGR